MYTFGTVPCKDVERLGYERWVCDLDNPSDVLYLQDEVAFFLLRKFVTVFYETVSVLSNIYTRFTYCDHMRYDKNIVFSSPDIRFWNSHLFPCEGVWVLDAIFDIGEDNPVDGYCFFRPLSYDFIGAKVGNMQSEATQEFANVLLRVSSMISF